MSDSPYIVVPFPEFGQEVHIPLDTVFGLHVFSPGGDCPHEFVCWLSDVSDAASDKDWWRDSDEAELVGRGESKQVAISDYISRFALAMAAQRAFGETVGLS